MSKWVARAAGLLGAALVAWIAVQIAAGYVSAEFGLPREQAVAVVVGLPALALVMAWNPKQSRRRRR